MRDDFLMNISETAEFFGTTHATIRDLIVAYGLFTRTMRNNGKARGLDLAAIRTIARALNRPAPTLSDLRSSLASA